MPEKSTCGPLSACTGTFIFAFYLSPIVKFGLNFSNVSLPQHNATIFTQAKIQGVFKLLATNPSFKARDIQVPLKSKIKFQGFSRSSTNPAIIITTIIGRELRINIVTHRATLSLPLSKAAVLWTNELITL